MSPHLCRRRRAIRGDVPRDNGLMCGAATRACRACVKWLDLKRQRVGRTLIVIRNDKKGPPMHHSIERSIALWKAQNGPFRKTIGNTARSTHKTFSDAARRRNPFFIDYKDRRCDFV